MKLRNIAYFSSTVLIMFAALVLFGGPQADSKREVWRPHKSVFEEETTSSNILDIGTIDKSQTHILIEKSRYKLQLLQGDSLLKMYPIVLGFDPVGDKFQEGDGRTPEGHFKIRSMYNHAHWSKFIWIDYPNQESWNRFNKRKIEGMLPEGATIGGEIGIHGVTEGGDSKVDNRLNWTLGCISLRTKDIVELYGAVQVGTAVEIVP